MNPPRKFSNNLGIESDSSQFSEEKRGRTKEGREEENMCSNKFDGPIRTKFKVIFLQFYTVGKELTVDHPKKYRIDNLALD